MIQFLTTPIFYLTPYILLWAVLNGLLVVGLMRLLKIQTQRPTQIAAGLTTTLTIILWNLSIAFNQSTIYLNVDAPVLRISWADALDALCVFAFTALILGAVVNREAPAAWVVKIAGLAALVTLVTDVFLF